MRGWLEFKAVKIGGDLWSNSLRWSHGTTQSQLTSPCSWHGWVGNLSGTTGGWEVGMNPPPGHIFICRRRVTLSPRALKSDVLALHTHSL